jgi:tripartite-type tricarboxylate transporter receptor subunit TctC
MKKVLLMLWFITSITQVQAQTQERIPSVWAMNISNIQGSYYRATLEEANRIQNKYEFMVEHKPGAGGEIAAVYVKNQRTSALLGVAAAYFVRPYLYKANYSFDQFKPIHVMATSPAALVTKDRSLQDIIGQNTISIGTAGAGSLTHLMALKFKEYYPTKNVVMVNYKSSTEALQDVLGGHTDLTFEFLGDAEAKGAKILGLTGRNKIKNYPLLKDIGYANQADIVGVYLILVKADMPMAQYTEIQSILIKAEQSSRVQELYAADYSGKPTNLKTYSDYATWYDRTIQYFGKITEGQRVE